MLEQAILEHAAALNNLADAIRGIGQLPLNLNPQVTITPTVTVAEVTAKRDEENLSMKDAKAAVIAEKMATKVAKPAEAEAVGPFYWEDTETQYFGKEDSIKALNKQLATKDSIKQINEDRFNELTAALRERNAKAQEKMAAEKKAPVEKASTSPSDEAVVPTVEDVIACFTKYLPKDLDAEERKARHAVVKPLLAKFGADKATNLKPEHRAEAIAFIEGKLAELDDEVV